MNTGALDEHIKLAQIEPVEKSAGIVGFTYLNLFSSYILKEFDDWVDTEPLGRFLIGYRNRIGFRMCENALHTCAGERIKMLRPEFNVPLPKNLNRSFRIKVTNLIEKFARYHAKADQKLREAHDITEFVHWALNPSYVSPKYGTWLPNQNLVDMRRLYEKYSAHQDLSATVKELVELSKVYLVMAS